ncbi:CDP-6-deoxy-delta-3,4-glucoseen reductase [Paenalcaligenes sp.]|uniref:CDP-6-deoxy-delta-3,4-glucoseen reductase n=1 Tax=Paenalcaligenes sp. TaxID=1966342 RepID=UPI00262962AA|nr:CDP-6-deoxy-delta-3,4-glucoseen reductase [Paenalcaligenes sp.]
MSYKVDVQPSGQVFEVAEDQTLLEAALAEGMMLRHSCREGTCGTCKGKVLAGQVDHADSDLEVLTQAERDEGFALFCRAKACSDLQIHAPEVTELKGISIQKTAARVGSIDRISDDVAIVRLNLPPTMPFNYFPGQYAEVILKDGSRRSYSMATVPGESNQLEWHIRNTGGTFSRFVYEDLKEKTLLRLEGPFGTFYLRDTDKPMVFVASGTGFAPIKALLEQLAAQNNTRPVSMYWGGRQLKDLYMHQWVVDFAKNHDWLTYTPVLSEVADGDTWDGATGYVHHQILADFSDLSGYEVYACGNPLMVDSARKDFTEQRGLDEENFFADAFV